MSLMTNFSSLSFERYFLPKKRLCLNGSVVVIGKCVVVVVGVTAGASDAHWRRMSSSKVIHRLLLCNGTLVA